MNLKPLSDHVVVKKMEESTTPSSIVLPETIDQERPETGEVVAVGPGKVGDNGQRITIDVKVGDKVVFKKYSPDEFELDGDTVLVLRAEDIVAIVE